MNLFDLLKPYQDEVNMLFEVKIRHRPHLVRGICFLLVAVLIFAFYEYYPHLYVMGFSLWALLTVVAFAASVVSFALFAWKDTLFELDMLGIVDESRPFRFGYLFWGEIDKIYSKKVHGLDFIEIQMKNPEELWERMSPKEQERAIKRMEQGHELVAIPLKGTKYTPFAVLQVMKTVAEGSLEYEFHEN